MNTTQPEAIEDTEMLLPPLAAEPIEFTSRFHQSAETLTAAYPPAARDQSPALSLRGESEPGEGRAAASLRRWWSSAFDAPSPDASMWMSIAALVTLLLAAAAAAHVLVVCAACVTLGMSIVPSFVIANRELAPYHSNRPPARDEGQGVYTELLREAFAMVRAENEQREQTVSGRKRRAS